MRSSSDNSRRDSCRGISASRSLAQTTYQGKFTTWRVRKYVEMPHDVARGKCKLGMIRSIVSISEKGHGVRRKWAKSSPTHRKSGP